MFKHIFWASVVLQAVLSSCAIAKTINVPAVSAERAIAIAHEYVDKNKIDVSHHFIAKVEYFWLHDEYKKPFWRVEWHLIGRPVKGGQIIVHVYQDGTASHGYGE
jgi:hypothetical protein